LSVSTPRVSSSVSLISSFSSPYNLFFFTSGPPLWSSCQSSWLLIQRSRVRLLALLDLLRSSGSGTGSTQRL
jgi:hypothetical protein